MMIKRCALLALPALLGLSFILSSGFAQDATEELKARLNNLRQKKAQIKNEYEDELREINKEADDKLVKIKTEFHKMRDEYLRDKKNKSDRLQKDYETKTRPINEEETRLVESLGSAIGSNFAKPKSERRK